MRIWSLHPQYLDRQGLLALWREALLAKKVLEGKTKGYRHHPQLERFKLSSNPLLNINSYLFGVWQEAISRGYEFKADKISGASVNLKKNYKKIKVHSGQVDYEFSHLLAKLKIRDQKRYEILKNTKERNVHFLFKVVSGGVEKWEKV